MEKLLSYEQNNIFQIGRNSKTNDKFRYEFLEGKFFREGSLPGALHDVLPGYGVVPNYLIEEPAYPLDPFLLERVPPLFKQPAGDF